MKTKDLALAGLIASAGLVSAQTAPRSIPTPVHDWGCEVLLCLANPAGPTAVAPCVPPIEKLWSELARGHAFPTCTMAAGPGGKSFADLTRRSNDFCPNGTSALGLNQVAMLSGPMPASMTPLAPSGAPTSYVQAEVGAIYVGIGEGDGSPLGPDGAPPPPKICVSSPRGNTIVPFGDGSISVSVFATIFTSVPRGIGRAIDVYIDDKFWQTVRW